ncbi:24925_t:CDS:2, partial [Gigaspora margarita]
KDLDQEFQAISIDELDYIQSNKKVVNLYWSPVYKALKGAFNNALIFTGLCEVISDAIEQKMKNKSNKNLKYREEFTNFLVILGKSNKNLKYSKEFTNFLVILGGISSKALDIFHQNLEGRLIQSIR